MNNFNHQTWTLQLLQHIELVVQLPILKDTFKLNLLQIAIENVFASARHQLKLIVYEPITEEVIQWIN